MKLKKFILLFITVVLCNLQINAQGLGAGKYGALESPLVMQGVDHTSMQSATSRALGGLTIGVKNDAGVMFANPAALQSITGLQISVGNLYQVTTASQSQQYYPVKYYPMWSLLMGSQTDGIPDVEIPTTATTLFDTASNTVPRQFDKLTPNWSHNKTKNHPLQITAAMPFKAFDMEFTAGIGATEYANMNYYYQNNNALSPAINFYRPFPDTVVQSSSGSYLVNWYQTTSQRSGSLTGYGAAISAKVMDELSVGLSGMYIKGSVDDFQSNVGRGKLIFLHYYAFWLDPDNYVATTQGTSDFKGMEFTISAIYKTQYFYVGASIKPPTVIDRDYSSTYTIDSTGTHAVTSLSGSDKIKLPWRGTIGISIPVKKKFEIGVEYEIRPYSSAVYTNNGGTESNPFKKCSELRAGISFQANHWLTLRAGGRDQVEVSEFYGNPIVGDPIRSQIYSGGFGINYWGIHLNVTYEYHQLKYDDMLANTIYRNVQINRNIIADVIYEIPFFNN